MKKRSLTNFLLVSALMLGGATTFVSCKDYDSDGIYNDINDQLTTKFNKIVEEQKAAIDEINKKLANIKQCDCNGLTDADKQVIIGLIDQQIKENTMTKDDVQDIVNSSIESLIEDNKKLNDAISKSTQLVNDLSGRVATLEGNVSNLTNELTNLTNEFNSYKTSWTEKSAAMCDSINHALILAREDSMRLDVLEGKVNQNTIDIDELKNQYNHLNNVTIPQISNDLEKAKGDIIEAQNTANEALNKANALKTEFDTKLEETKSEILKSIEEKYATKEELENLRNEIDLKFIQTELAQSELDNRITNLEEKYNSLIAILSNYFNNLITGVIMQGSESPITGYVSTPFGVSMNILGAYYGNADKMFTFGGQTFRAGKLISEANANAGLIFINVNPVNVNPSGITFTLVDSQGKEAPFKLTPVNTDRTLKFGVSRAINANANGFYALEVKLDEDKIKEAQTWTSADAADLKSAAKNVLDKLRNPSTSRLNVGDIVSSIESVFNNRLTRYGVKATWTVDGADGKKVTKSVVSELNLAATALSPLSYDFLKNGVSVDVPTIPSLQERLGFENYKFNWTPIEGMGDVKTSVTLEDMPDINSIKIDGITINPDDIHAGANIIGKETVTGVVNDDGTVTVDLSGLSAEVTINDIKVDTKNLNVTFDKKAQTYDVTIPMDEFNKIIDNINNQVGNMIGNVNDMIDRVDGWAESIDGKVIDRVNGYIKRFNNLLKNSNSLLQPTMLYTAQSGAWNQLPNVKEAAAYLKLNGGKASTVFIATSYTAELLAPAYKKYVHVTEAPTGSKVAGRNLNTVIDGNTYKIGFEADKAGTYEITYEAVDYAGKTVSKKFYVKVVK